MGQLSNIENHLTLLFVSFKYASFQMVPTAIRRVRNKSRKKHIFWSKNFFIQSVFTDLLPKASTILGMEHSVEQDTEGRNLKILVEENEGYIHK